MTYRVRVRKDARNDLEDAALWYESQRGGLGGEFLDEVKQAFEKIASDPTTYRVLRRDTRRAMLQRFPFGVFYRIHESTVVAVAVMHSSRDPKNWKQRT